MAINPLRLANEWRDSLALTAGIALAMSNFDAIEVVISAICMRQGLRGIVWDVWPPMKIEGGPPLPSADHVAAISRLIANAILALTPDSSFFVTCLGTFFFGVSLIEVSLRGWRPSMRACVEAWDWPRKRGDGGETQKLKDWAQSLTGAGQLAPIASS